MKPALAIANKSSGLAKTRFIGLPITHEASTSTGATTRAIWIAEPTHMLKTMSISSCRANTTAANRSAAVPTSASTTTPINTGESPSCAEAASSAAATSSASIAIRAVPGHHDNQRAGKTPLGLAARRIAGEHVAMGEEGVDEVGGVEQ